MRHVDRLRLENFRCYETVELIPSPHVNILAGANAQGKTSLLEAVYLLATGRILRSSRDALAIRTGAEESTVWGSVGPPPGFDVQAELKLAGRKRVTINGASLPRASDLLGRLPTVTFSASDLGLVTDEPAGRRLFLDTELSQLYAAYLKHLAGYKRALEQRNAILRRWNEGVRDIAALEVWEAPLAQHGAPLRQSRRDWVQRLQAFAAARHADLGAGEVLDLRYAAKDDCATEAELAEALERGRAEDGARGSTRTGPHRDDVDILVNGQLAKTHGSQGQQRTAVIALKLAVLDVARETLGFAPVLLLDDVFSDLDQSRRERLVAAAVQEGGQVFLTCTEAEQAGAELIGTSRLFRVRSGEVTAL